MTIINKYLKLRKQNDSVKLITLLFIVLIIFIVSSVLQVCKFYQKIHTKTEYTLTSSDIENLKKNLDKIKMLDKNIAVSIEKDYFITFNNGQISIQVRELSREYLLMCYGIDDNMFYINNSTFKLFNNKTTKFSTLYQKEDKKLYGNFILQKNLANDTPYALKCGTSASLNIKSNIYTVCAMFESADISGETSKEIEALGFEIKNKSDIEQQKYSQEMFFLKIKYNLFIIILTIIFILVMIKKEIFKMHV